MGGVVGRRRRRRRGARSPTASTTARRRSSLLGGSVVGDSPVVPETTRPSWPCVDQVRRQRGGRRRGRRAPASVNGVTIAVRTRPNGAVVAGSCEEVTAVDRIGQPWPDGCSRTHQQTVTPEQSAVTVRSGVRAVTALRRGISHGEPGERYTALSSFFRNEPR